MWNRSASRCTAATHGTENFSRTFGAVPGTAKTSALRGPVASSTSSTKGSLPVSRAKPARVFRFEEIAEAHRVMESSDALGKLVVEVA